jgi:hypothetical protein
MKKRITSRDALEELYLCVEYIVIYGVRYSIEELLANFVKEV